MGYTIVYTISEFQYADQDVHDQELTLRWNLMSVMSFEISGNSIFCPIAYSDKYQEKIKSPH